MIRMPSGSIAVLLCSACSAHGASPSFEITVAAGPHERTNVPVRVRVPRGQIPNEKIASVTLRTRNCLNLGKVGSYPCGRRPRMCLALREPKLAKWPPAQKLTADLSFKLAEVPRSAALVVKTLPDRMDAGRQGRADAAGASAAQ